MLKHFLIAFFGALAIAVPTRAAVRIPDATVPAPSARAELAFRRAIALWSSDDPEPARARLAALDVSLLSPEFADRALILTATAALLEGDDAALLALRKPARAEMGSALGPALALLAGIDPGAGLPSTTPALLVALAVESALAGGDLTRARSLFAAGEGNLPETLRLHFAARLATEPESLWRDLADRRIREHWERPLVAGAALRVARIAQESGESPLEWLAKARRDDSLVPAAAALATRYHLSRGDSLAALTSAASEPLLRARLLLDARRIEEAWTLLREAEASAAAELGRLDRLAASPPVDSLLAGALPVALHLAGDERDAFLKKLGLAAADLSHPVDVRSLLESAGLKPAASERAIALLSCETQDSLRVLRWEERRGELARDRYHADLSAHDVDRELRRGQIARLAARAAALRAALLESGSAGRALADSAALGAADLEALLDDYRDLLLVRARRQLAAVERHAAALSALERLRLSGPRARRAAGPDSVDIATLVAAAAELSQELAAHEREFARRTPVLLGPEHRGNWLARLREGPLAAGARREDLLVLLLDLEAELLALRDQPDRRRDELAGRLAAAEAEYESLIRTRHAVETELAQRVISLRRAALLARGEALDYHLAETAQLRFEQPGSPETHSARRAEARRRAEDFLARHTDSPARSELRFRLAELLIDDAREGFRARMATFLAGSGAADAAAERALAPFLDLEPVFALYREILAEDPGFPRRDALLFNLGMLLDDLGEPRGERRLEQLLAEHPASPHRFRATLRLAERARATGRVELAAARYATVAADGEPALARVALYQLAWIRLTQERWLESAGHYRQLLDLERSEDSEATLDDEAARHLVECLARAGGAPAFAGFFAGADDRTYAPALLVELADLLRGYGFYRRAAAADSLALARAPLAADALGRARAWLGDLRAAGDEGAVAEHLDLLGRHFAPASDWHRAQADDSLRLAGSAFARDCVLTLSAGALKRARADQDLAAWSRVRDLLLTLLERWPDDTESSRRQLLAGEASEKLGLEATALEHYAIAALDSAWALPADWRALAIHDGLRLAAPADTTQRDRFLAAGDRYLDRHGADSRAPALLWQLSALRDAASKHAAAAAGWWDFAQRWPDAQGAPLAAARGGDALARGGDHAGAAERLLAALAHARSAGRDSLVSALSRSVPAQRFLAAEALPDQDCRRPRAFAALAVDWPDFTQIDQVLYRAGLDFADCGEADAALAAWTALADRESGGPLRSDALLRIAELAAKSDPRRAAGALARYSRAVGTPTEAASALLRAIDLVAADSAPATTMRDEFLARFPAHEAAMTEILHVRALSELERHGQSPLRDPAGLGGALAAYLAAAVQRPELADAELLAWVDYLNCLARYEDFTTAELGGNLGPALERKQALLAELATASRSCLGRGSLRWGRGAAHLLGRSLYEFGDALLALEAPSELSGDDRLAYLDVLAERAWEFQDRGEAAWTEILRKASPETGDPDNWIVITQNNLWPRIARRFLHLPEMNYPLVATGNIPEGE